jgi:hypothetical protein
LQAIGISISERQVMRLLIDKQDDFLIENREVLQAGLETARWIARLSQLVARTPGKWRISAGWRRQGRHHSTGGHADAGISAAVILGGGCAGRLSFICWSRRA